MDAIVEMINQMPIPSKKTMLKAKDVYNEYNSDKITGCMCNGSQRQSYAVKIKAWFESRN